MTREQKYRYVIDLAIKEVGDGYDINYSIDVNSNLSFRGISRDASGKITFKKGYATNLSYSFEIDESFDKIYTVGKILGIGNDNIPSLKKIDELNKRISLNLGAMLIKRELETDSLREDNFKRGRGLMHMELK